MKDGLNAADGETLLAATPARRLLTTYFDDGLSTLLGGTNGDLSLLYERSFFEGLFKHLYSPPRTLTLIDVAVISAAHNKLKTITQFFRLSIFARLTGLADNLVKPEFDRSGRTLQPGEDGGVAEYTAPPPPQSLDAPQLSSLDTRPYDPITDGGAGGRWRAVDSAALVASGPVGLRPWTYIEGRVSVGDTEVPALPFSELGVPATSPYLRVGDRVVIDPGRAEEEVVTLASVSPMRFTTPLVNDHEWGAMVLLADADAPVTGGGGGTPPPPATGISDGPTAGSSAIVPLVPARVLESRVGAAPTVDGVLSGGGRVAAGSITELPVAGRGGVPGDALAVMLNVTAVGPAGSGFLTVFPCGAALPEASNVNYVAGDVVPNAVLAKVGAGGAVCVYSYAETDLIVDVNGYVPAGGSVGTLVPARVLESRVGAAPTVDGVLSGGGRVAAGSITELPVAGRGGVPGDALAVMLNVTAVGPAGSGFLTVFPCGAALPEASNVNYVAGDVVPNAVLAKVGAGGAVCVYSYAETDLIVDVNGYVPAGGSVGTLVPARVLESRVGAAPTVDGVLSGGGRVAAGSITELPVAGRGGVPGDALAVMLNVTAVGPAGSGFLTVFPCGAALPEASNVNYVAGDVVPNAVLAKVGAGGAVCVYSYAETDLIVDVNGYVP